MKREADFELSAYRAVFKDIALWDPELEPFLALDYERIERIVTSRGLSYIMIDLPEAAKVVDQAVARGRLWVDQLPNSMGTVHHGYRMQFRCLFSIVFDDEGLLRDNVSPNAYRHLRMVLLMAKKMKEDCSDAAIEAEVDTFLQVDESLHTPFLNWDGDDLFEYRSRFRQCTTSQGVVRLNICDSLRSDPDLFPNGDVVRPKLLALVQLVSDMIVRSFPDPDWRQIIPRHGPGAVADMRTGEDKYQFPTWTAKLEETFPFNYFGLPREDLAIRKEELPVQLDWFTGHNLPKTRMSRIQKTADLPTSEVNYPRNTEPPVRLLAVPKTLKGPRMIASEPVSHQFLQLGLMKWFRDNLPKPLQNSIDFKNQELSRAACLEASKDGSSATVDLSAASDRLSCWTVERMLRANPSLLCILHACRSRWLTNATKIGEPYFHRLKKYAPMGNGTTFPLQSIVYAVISIAAILYEEGIDPTPESILLASERVRVYGDDIILPSSAVHSLFLSLEHLQFKVNHRKTFVEGQFRESCGMDAWKGVDVTPIYMPGLETRLTPEGLASWVDVSKNAARKGYDNLCRWMESKLTPSQRKLLPRSEVSLGCLTLYPFAYGTDDDEVIKTRYNRRLHRREVLGLSVEPKNEKVKRHSYGDLLQYFLEDPEPITKWTAGYVTRKRVRLKTRWVPVY